jgi:hypothetical protein
MSQNDVAFDYLFDDLLQHPSFANDYIAASSDAYAASTTKESKFSLPRLELECCEEVGMLRWPDSCFTDSTVLSGRDIRLIY